MYSFYKKNQQERRGQTRKNSRQQSHVVERDEQVNIGHRLLFVYVVLVCVVLVVGFRLYQIQVVEAPSYNDLALRQHFKERVLTPNRGSVYLQSHDSALFPVALDREYFLAFLSPRDIAREEFPEVIDSVSRELGVAQSEIEWKLAKRDDVFEIIAHKIERQEKERIQSLQIPGLHFRPEYFRYYPGGELASQVVGFVGFDDKEGYKGRYGVEAKLDNEMTGETGVVKEIRTARGGWNTLFDRILTPENNGSDIVLTIDHVAQKEVERILVEDLEEFGADRASAIVMEVETGRIIAMANVPTFSPNQYGEVEDISLFKNASISDAYESGSVFKTFTLAMGLDAGKIRPETTYVDPGVVEIGGFKIRNAEDKRYDLQTMTQVLEESINTGVIHVERLLGNKLFKDYVQQFGFGERTGINLPAESSGNINNLRDIRRTIEYYTASYGQGLTVTPMQLVAAYGALANDGVLMRPQIVKKMIAADGVETVIEPFEVRQVISEQSSEEITQMLARVVESGHARLAAVPGYRVGGKTGTAQVVDPESGGYYDDRINTTFVGYAPIDDPKYVTLVKYENPQNVEWAATSAAPTFGKIMRFMLPYFGIEQSDDVITVIPEDASIVD